MCGDYFANSHTWYIFYILLINSRKKIQYETKFNCFCDKKNGKEETWFYGDLFHFCWILKIFLKRIRNEWMNKVIILIKHEDDHVKHLSSWSTCHQRCRWVHQKPSWSWAFHGRFHLQCHQSCGSIWWCSFHHIHSELQLAWASP